MDSSKSPYEQIDIILHYIETTNPYVDVDYEGTLKILFSDVDKWVNALEVSIVFFNKMETSQ